MIGNASEEFLEAFMKGDRRCKYKIGDLIVKKVFEKGDVHLKGTEGTIVGSMLHKEMGCYLVLFESDAAYTFTIDDKICLKSEFL